MVHQMTSHSWAMVPVFALATIPVLWWRRSVIAVTGIALVVMVLHDLLFGWVTRCGAGLPLAFVLAYLGAVALERKQAWIALGLATLLTARCSWSTRPPASNRSCSRCPIVLIVFGIGRAVRHRTAMSAELKARTAELQQLRDERVALEVAERPGPALPASSTGCCRSGSASSRPLPSRARTSTRTARRRCSSRSRATAARPSTACARSSVSCAAATSRSLRRRPSRTSTRCWPGTPGPTRG